MVHLLPVSSPLSLTTTVVVNGRTVTPSSSLRVAWAVWLVRVAGAETNVTTAVLGTDPVLDLTVLTIPPNSLLPATTYRVSFSVQTGGALAYRDVVVDTATVPTGGLVHALLPSGAGSGTVLGGITRLNVSTSGWVDAFDALPLTFHFYSTAGSGGARTLLGVVEDSSTGHGDIQGIRLPAPPLGESIIEVQLFVVASNRHGGVSVSPFVSVTVSVPSLNDVSTALGGSVNSSAVETLGFAVALVTDAVTAASASAALDAVELASSALTVLGCDGSVCGARQTEATAALQVAVGNVLEVTVVAVLASNGSDGASEAQLARVLSATTRVLSGESTPAAAAESAAAIVAAVLTSLDGGGGVTTGIGPPAAVLDTAAVTLRGQGILAIASGLQEVVGSSARYAVRRVLSASGSGGTALTMEWVRGAVDRLGRAVSGSLTVGADPVTLSSGAGIHLTATRSFLSGSSAAASSVQLLASLRASGTGVVLSPDLQLVNVSAIDTVQTAWAASPYPLPDGGVAGDTPVLEYSVRSVGSGADVPLLSPRQASRSRLSGRAVPIHLLLESSTSTEHAFLHCDLLACVNCVCCFCFI